MIFFDSDQRRLYREVKEQLKIRKDWKFTIKLKKKAEKEEFTIGEVLKPRKHIFENKIPHNAMVWKKMGSKWNLTAKSLYNSFEILEEKIIFLFENQ